ncbi:MAG: Ppx/GppA family phosphatase [Planctomycetes bacterium]|nr:Ppx/GppA family phosphatase [Planctomycetota bacterium]MCB9868840.1 Ppx/GppA family phosphatase [Planctomycetota bacterium]MCB9889554.1 Ppx/GppA family phosphatase [Planctomycetota bacterium]
MPNDAAEQSVAAIDLGSNSFHLVIGRVTHGHITIIDRLRDPVRLAAGLDDSGRLDEEVVERAIASLERFGQRIQNVPRQNIRAVGTNTLRRIRHAPGHFLSRARRALGVPIEVLPGPEEARLIYLGVAHDLSDDAGRRLVIDIGGGSTELVLGERFEPALVDSLQMGCVSYMRFFPDGKITARAFKNADTAARLELHPIEAVYRKTSWVECIGASGTIRACAAILEANRWSEGAITLEGLRRLRKAIVAAGQTDAIALEGLSTPDRAAVLPAGVAVLEALFRSLRIERMLASEFALREGLLYDLVGRIGHEDVRERTILAMSARYQVDRDQALRVENTAMSLFRAVRQDWSLDPQSARSLAWACALHEIGLTISHAGYHKHGHYLLANSSMPGFSREDQSLLATLVRGHRRRLPTELFDALPPFHREQAWKLCLLLRLAARLNRGRSHRGLPKLEVRGRERGLILEFPEGWLERHPLTRADMESERLRLRKGGFELKVK